MADEARSHVVEQPELQPGAIQVLQFEQAEYTAPTGLTCGQCRQEITRSYYEAAGQVLCEACRNRLQAPLRAGSGVKRFCGALVLGVLAAMAGARRYFAITALTGYQLGLVSVFALVFLLTKAKLLVLGLTKASTLFSMLLSLGMYASKGGSGLYTWSRK